MAVKKIDFQAHLNAEQYRVVTEGEGPCLVLAGPGSGKTRTLVYRVAYLLHEAVPATAILLLTFTNKAAREMLRRVEELYGRYPSGLTGGTFHHVGNITLRRYAAVLGYTTAFTILDRSDSRDLLAQIAETGRPAKDRYFPKPDVIADVVGFAVNSCRPVESVIGGQYPYLEKFTSEIEKIAAAYHRKKKAANVMDFDDLLHNWLQLLQTEPAVLKTCQDKFRYILVDEYQDTNRLQFETIRLLAEKHRNLMAVGDDAQSIYSFRAAEVRNALEFPRVFPDAKIFRLETNYRSVPEILSLANQSIRHNRNQFPKTLKSLHSAGPAPMLVSTGNGFSEARYVARRVMELRSEGLALSDIAVLFRSRYQATELEMELTGKGIPYLIRGGLRFYEQAHIKDILSYLKILVNQRDELAWRRVLLQVEGVGRGYFGRVWEKIRTADAPLGRFLQEAAVREFPRRSQPGVASLQKLFREMTRPEMADAPAELIRTALNSDYHAYCLATYQDGPERILEIEELAKIAATFDSTEKFLSETIMGEEYQAEEAAAGPEKNSEILTLSTVHQAKGLEWKAVFIIGLTDGRFPYGKSFDDPEKIEEERRIFYVAVTRAKTHLYLLQPLMGFGWEGGTISQPSRFVQELPEDCYHFRENDG